MKKTLLMDFFHLFQDKATYIFFLLKRIFLKFQSCTCESAVL